MTAPVINAQAERSQQEIRLRRQRVMLWLRYAVLVVLALLFMFPIAWSFVNSIKLRSEALAVPPTYLPSEISLQNYEGTYNLRQDRHRAACLQQHGCRADHGRRQHRLEHTRRLRIRAL